jgi:hypothetical protein
MKFLQLLLTVLVLLMAGCGGGGGSSVGVGNLTSTQNADISNRIYVVTAHTGKASAGSAGQDYEVTLSDVEPGVDWYTDRPDRSTGNANTQTFVATDWQAVYGKVAPNALLHYQNASGVHGLFGSVNNVAYDPGARTLRFTLHLAKASYDISAGVGSLTAPVLTLLNNLQPPAEGSAFALHANSSTLVADGSGGYRLVLKQVDDAVFWMDNAPSRAGDFESVGNFVNLWPERFAQVPPNASLAGDPGNGDYGIVPLTLSAPVYDSATRSVSFTATPLKGPGILDVSTDLGNVVLFVDAGTRGSPESVFSQTWRGVAYSPIPSKFNSAPTGAFFDSDITAENFQALWGSKNGCGRNDLEAMAAAGINLVRLYDYNYQRGSAKWTTAGNGHIAFLDKAQALGIKVIIPISNYNFRRDDGKGNRPWDNIDLTVTQIVNSLKKNGSIHPAVHSLSIGNELDLGQDGVSPDALIQDAVRVAGILHGLAPDHYMTVPLSNGNEKKYYEQLRQQLPPDLYKNRFYNSVQTFKREQGADLENNILRAYDNLKLGVPLVITELGTNNLEAVKIGADKVDLVVGQARAVRNYMNANPDSQVKGFAIFQWQNANWKRNGLDQPVNTEMYFGIHAYDGSLCQSKTGKFDMYRQSDGAYALFHDDETYDVDKLAPLTSGAHPEGLLSALSVYFK